MSRGAVVSGEAMARRADRSILRATRVLADLRQDPALFAAVVPYMAPGSVASLYGECREFDRVQWTYDNLTSRKYALIGTRAA